MKLGFLGMSILHLYRSIRSFQRDVACGENSVMPRVDEEFRALRIDHPDPARAFDGRSAEVVEDRLEGVTVNDIYELVRVHRFARNGHGEYFFFISDGSGKPFFKPVSQLNARIASGKKYRAPASAGVDSAA